MAKNKSLVALLVVVVLAVIASFLANVVYHWSDEIKGFLTLAFILPLIPICILMVSKGEE